MLRRGGLWCAAARRAARGAPARLDQPAFLAAARLAGRRTGAGRHRRGGRITGATTFQIEPSLDSGPVYGIVTETIRPADTSGDLLERLAVSGAALLSTTLDGIDDATLTPRPQPSDGVSIAPKITVEEARVRWDLPAQVVERRIRAVTPNPGAWTQIGELRVKLGPVHVDADAAEPLSPGAIHVDRKNVWIGTGSDPVRLGQLQPPGKKPMNAIDWARGARLDTTARAS